MCFESLIQSAFDTPMSSESISSSHIELQKGILLPKNTTLIDLKNAVIHTGGKAIWLGVCDNTNLQEVGGLNFKKDNGDIYLLNFLLGVRNPRRKNSMSSLVIL